MDTLALLCNLHADGPETLQLLRRAGWDTLAELEAVEAGELAGALSLTVDRAQRLQREALHLRERLEGADPAPKAIRPARAEPATPPPSKQAAELELPAREVLIPRAIARPAPERSVAPPPAPAAAPAPVAAPHRTGVRGALVPGVIDGLDRETCERLADAGVADLAALAAALPLELSGATGIDYTRLLRLQFLARRAAPAQRAIGGGGAGAAGRPAPRWPDGGPAADPDAGDRRAVDRGEPRGAGGPPPGRRGGWPGAGEAPGDVAGPFA